MYAEECTCSPFSLGVYPPPPPFLKLNPQIHFQAGGRVVHSTPTPTDFPQYQYQCYLVLLLEKRNFIAIKIKVIIYQGLF